MTNNIGDKAKDFMDENEVQIKEKFKDFFGANLGKMVFGVFFVIASVISWLTGEGFINETSTVELTIIGSAGIIALLIFSMIWYCIRSKADVKNDLIIMNQKHNDMGNQLAERTIEIETLQEDNRMMKIEWNRLVGFVSKKADFSKFTDEFIDKLGDETN